MLASSLMQSAMVESIGEKAVWVRWKDEAVFVKVREERRKASMARRPDAGGPQFIQRRAEED
jgi:hypothetical protein